MSYPRPPSTESPGSTTVNESNTNTQSSPPGPTTGSTSSPVSSPLTTELSSTTPSYSSTGYIPSPTTGSTSFSTSGGTSSSATEISSFLPTQTTITTTPGTTPSTSAVVLPTSSQVNDGAIAGGVIGGTVFLALLIIGTILCYRRRKRRIAPSSEFAETIKRGEMPVLRLDSGVEIVPTTPLHVPLPLQQDSYRTSAKLPDGMMWSDAQSTRYSLQKPLQPLRYPVHKDSDDSMMHRGHTVGSSSDDSQEFWSGESGNIETRKFVSKSLDSGYSPLMQDAYPMEHSHAVETGQNAHANLWDLSVAPTAQSRPSSARRYNENGQALIPLVPVRRSVDVHSLPPLVPVRRSVDIGQKK